MSQEKTIKIAYVGGGSQNWAPTIIRDIVNKPGMEKARLDIRLIDTDERRAHAIQALFDVKFREWKTEHARVMAAPNTEEAVDDADFVIITISTGRLPAMRHDLAIPEKYGVYHTVGDTVGPGGWSRALRNIPVFKAYADLIKRVAPNAFVLNYTNPMGTLTKVLADELGAHRVVGLCHGFFESLEILQRIFGLESESDLEVNFGGLNHYFWIIDFKVGGADGYPLLWEKLREKNLPELIGEAYKDPMGFSSRYHLAHELLSNYGFMPYVGDRHTCEFFGCYITNPDIMERFHLVRTSVEEREGWNQGAEEQIRNWTEGRRAEHLLEPTPSRETAADIIHAIAFDQEFRDVVNTVNDGQIPDLPQGTVVETMGRVDATGFHPMAVGPMPAAIKPMLLPHADVQLRTVAAGLAGDEEAALTALLADPVCSLLTASDIKKMGRELLEANRAFIPENPIGGWSGK